MNAELAELTARVEIMESILGLRGKDPRQMDAILTAIAGVYQIQPQVITGPRRTAVAYRPRMIFCWMARRAGYSTHQIGKYLDRDHSAVVYASAAMEDQLDTDPQFLAGIRSLAATLNIPLPERYSA